MRLASDPRTIAIMAVMAIALSGCASNSSVKRVQTQLSGMQKSLGHLHQSINGQHKQLTAVDQKLSTELSKLTKKQQQIISSLKSLDVRQRSLERTSTAIQAVTLVPFGASAGSPQSSNEDTLFRQVALRSHEIAQGRAKVPATRKAPDVLLGIDYSTYEKIRYTANLPEWDGSGFFSLKFRPAGFVFANGVRINLLTSSRIKTLKFAAGNFNWPKRLAAQITGAIPVAGFNVSSGNNNARFLEFVGADYFRASAVGEPFGSMARALAVNTASSNTSESFPRFTEYWLGATHNTFKATALLSGHNVSGAWNFSVTPKKHNTRMQIRAIFYLKHNIDRLGLAPLNTMYFQGPASLSRPNPLIRAAHNADGLLINSTHKGWIWIPLRNPSRLKTMRIAVRSLSGFGFMQRARTYGEYEVPNKDYARRPDVWVSPHGNWGEGWIVLVELPSTHSGNDNIVAFFQPKTPPKKGASYSYSYGLDWNLHGPIEQKIGRVLNTRLTAMHAGKRLVIIDYGQGELRNLPHWVHVKPEIEASNIQINHIQLERIQQTGNWQLSFTINRSTHPEKVKAWLSYDGRRLTETWLRQLP